MLEIDCLIYGSDKILLPRDLCVYFAHSNTFLNVMGQYFMTTGKVLSITCYYNLGKKLEGKFEEYFRKLENKVKL